MSRSSVKQNQRIMIKKIIILVSILLTFGAGVWLTNYYHTWQEVKVTEESQVLLEKIKTVCKLVTVEGYFSEVYDYEDYWGYDLSFFRKKALLRVKAKVSVGYDLNDIKIETNTEDKTVIISNLPQPEIISIDHDVDYYDLSQGTFNSFSEKDYTMLNKKAKRYIEATALESPLLKSAEKQGNQVLDLVEFMVENMGWTVKYEDIKPSLSQ